jgi:hypothetical protein
VEVYASVWLRLHPFVARRQRKPPAQIAQAMTSRHRMRQSLFATMAESGLAEPREAHDHQRPRRYRSQRFSIRSLKVGDNTLENVTGSIAPGARGLLLRQSFLRRFKSWSIDNQNQALILN